MIWWELLEMLLPLVELAHPVACERRFRNLLYWIQAESLVVVQDAMVPIEVFIHLDVVLQRRCPVDLNQKVGSNLPISERITILGDDILDIADAWPQKLLHMRWHVVFIHLLVVLLGGYLRYLLSLLHEDVWIEC